MTNRTNIRPYSAGVILNNVKKPRLRRFDLTFDGPPPPTPEGLNNGVRPHGGYRGMRPLPPGQFSFNKDEDFHHELDVEYQILVNNENYESHGAPFWLNDVQREITHSGESPLFTNNLLPSGKYEPDPSVASFDRSQRANKRRPLVPRRRHLNGRREYYRPNSTHHYLSATDLRNLHENEENMAKYGRPTRTTLLRARQRTNSAPVNAYDIRRENNRRGEDLKSSAAYSTSKDMYIERDYVQVSYRYVNLYSGEGESMHSFLTGARYNRAHLLDSKGLTVYGVYMPRGHPGDCFITGPRRIKDGDHVPSAPPDSPRSDLDESPTPVIVSRPTSSKPHISANAVPRIGSGRPSTRHSNSRPQSMKKSSSRVSSSRPRSSKDQSPSNAQVNQQPQQKNVPKTPEKKELPLPDEVTMAMPDHINKGKQGVYVTLKGQKMIESVDSKLPRVTGVSLPKIQKPRDYVDEMLFVNQPPPTPVEPSLMSVDKTKPDISNADEKSTEQNKEKLEETEVTQENKTEVKDVEDKQQNVGDRDEAGKIIPTKQETQLETSQSETVAPNKKVNFEDLQVPKQEPQPETPKEGVAIEKDVENVKDTENTDNVVFFMTEEDAQIDKETENKGGKTTEQSPNVTYVANSVTRNMAETTDNKTEAMNGSSNDENGSNGDGEQEVETVIKVEILETDKKVIETETSEENEETKPLTSKDYPFNAQNEDD
ncbi:hypothetical protein ACF0H5_020999 [Mactra antiquata]